MGHSMWDSSIHTYVDHGTSTIYMGVLNENKKEGH